MCLELFAQFSHITFFFKPFKAIELNYIRGNPDVAV